MKPQQLRFHEIDLLRGVACLCVLFFHYLSRGPRGQWMEGVDYPWVESLARYGYLGVHLFFVISGFVILMSAQGGTPRSFVASRVARLYPALWIGATLTAGTAWILGDARFAIPLPDYLINLTMLAHWFNAPYVDGAYWSLAYELHFYILVWIALRLGLMRHLEWLLAGWLLVATINAIRPMWPVEFWLNARWAPFFAAGGLFFLMRTRGVTRARLGLLAGAFTLALVYALSDGAQQNIDAGQALIQLPIVAAIVTAIFAVFWRIATGRFRMEASPATYFAGILTYPVYVIHQNFGFMLFGQLKASGSVPLSIFLTVTIVLVLSWTIHVLAEVPIGLRLRRVLDKRQMNRQSGFAAGLESRPPAEEQPGAASHSFQSRSSAEQEIQPAQSVDTPELECE